MENKELLEKLITTDPLVWAHTKRLKTKSGLPYNLKSHNYQIDLLQTDKRVTNIKKGTQIGITLVEQIDAIHGLIYKRYPQGVLYMMPSEKHVERFSKLRFTPMFDENRWMKKYLLVNNVNEKIINGGSLIFVGARAIRVGGSSVKDSAALRTFECDRIVRDEIDLQDMDMVEQSKQRLNYSNIRQEVNLASPTYPDYGIDALYEQCVVPETKILTTDLRWKLAGELKLGDKIIGFDENRLSSNKTRRYRETEVTNCSRAELPCVKVHLDDGNTITCSLEHKFLIDRDGRNIRWRRADKLKTRDKLLCIKIWEEEKTQESGWVAGVYDGEGYITRSKPDKKKRRGRASRIGFVQKVGAVLSQTETFLTKRGFSFDIYNTPSGCFSLQLKGGLPEYLRFLGTFRPVRLLQKSSVIWNDVSVGNDHGNTKKPIVERVEYVGFKEVVTLGTKHKTFIANGLLSHNSDQRLWQIKCRTCGKHTCIETDWESCIVLKDGVWKRICLHCHNEIFPTDGKWETEYSDREDAGFWPSSFLSPRADLKGYMKRLLESEGSKRCEALRSIVGIASIESENQLSETTILSRCTRDPNQIISTGETAMGVDIGKQIHVVIGIRTAREAYDILNVSRVNNLNELHDLALKMNVHSGVIDSGPHDHGVREFQKTEPYKIYLCQYSEQMPGKPKFDGKTGMVKCNRNEWMDKVHTTFTENNIRIPRPSVEINEYAHEMTRTAKTIIENPDTGLVRPRWIKLGEEHYFHGTLYFLLAASRTSPRQREQIKINRPTHSVNLFR